jgi:hypothetical protein
MSYERFYRSEHGAAHLSFAYLCQELVPVKLESTSINFISITIEFSILLLLSV